MAEVVVRFAGTVLDVAHVRPGGRFRIGTAPGVDLALELGGVSTFPIVDATSAGFVVRHPAGTRATRNGLVMHEPEARLDASDLIELRFGAAVVTIALAELPAAPLARPELDRRAPAYLGGSLVVHLMVWAAAILLAIPPRPPKPRAVHVAHPTLVRIAARPPEPPRPPPQSQPPELPRTSKPSATATGTSQLVGTYVQPPSESHEPSPWGDPKNGPAYLAKMIGEMHLGKQLSETGPLYVEDDVHEGDFGKGRAFDPTGRPEFGTIQSARHYDTVATGRAAGDHYSLVDEHERVHARPCDGECSVDGPLAEKQVEYLLGYKLREMAACYSAEAEDALEVKLELVIDPDGRVREAHGPGKAGACAARIASAVAFPAAADETRVTFSVTFEPPYKPKLPPPPPPHAWKHRKSV